MMLHTPKMLPSIFGQIEFTSSLSKLHQDVIDKLPTHERSRLGLQNDFMYLTSKMHSAGVMILAFNVGSILVVTSTTTQNE